MLLTNLENKIRINSDNVRINSFMFDVLIWPTFKLHNMIYYNQLYR